MTEDGVDGRSRRDTAGLADQRADPQATSGRNVRLPGSSVEPADGLSPGVLVVQVSEDHPDGGRWAARHQQRWRTPAPDLMRLPVRVPGAHLHPQLRRFSSWAGSSGRAGISA